MKSRIFIISIILSVGLILGLSVPVCFAQDDTVMIGIDVPLSGSYQFQGEDELNAYKLAIEEINKKGGILGKKIIYSVRDTQTNKEVSRKNAEALISEGAVLITGSVSSSVAIAHSEVCQANKVLCMPTITHSNATTGKNAHRYNFRWYINAHQSAKAMAEILVSRFGNDAKYAFIYADYTWGQTCQKSIQEVVEAAGSSTVLNLPTELGKPSFIPELLKAKTSGADVLVLAHFGKDMINALKQAHSMGLTKQMKVVFPLMEIHMAEPLGPEMMQGIISTSPWYHGLSEKYAGSKAFVDLFEAKYSKKPGSGAATAWVNIMQYADAVERAGTFDSTAVVKALEGHKFTLLQDEEYWRDWDHQAIRPLYILEGKTPAESKDKWDLFKIIETKSGEEIARTAEENPVTLEPLE